MRLVPEDLPTFGSIRERCRGAAGAAAAGGAGRREAKGGGVGRGRAAPLSPPLLRLFWQLSPPRRGDPSLPPPGTAQRAGPTGPATARGPHPPARAEMAGAAGAGGARGDGGARRCRGSDNGPGGERQRAGPGGRGAPPSQGSEGAGCSPSERGVEAGRRGRLPAAPLALLPCGGLPGGAALAAGRFPERFPAGAVGAGAVSSSLS